MCESFRDDKCHRADGLAEVVDDVLASTHVLC